MGSAYPSDYHRGRYENLSDDVLSSEDADAADSKNVEGTAQVVQKTTVKLAMVHLLCQSGTTSDAFVDGEGDAPDDVAVLREVQVKIRRLVDELPDPAGLLIRKTYFEGNM